MIARPAWRCCAAALAAAVLVGGTAGAEEGAAERLQEIERSLEEGGGQADTLERQSAALADEVRRLQRDLVAAAKAAQDREEEISELEQTLVPLEEAAAERETELAARREQLYAVASALQRLSIQPPEAMLLGPSVPLDTVRSAKLLAVALPAVEGRARALRAELDGLRDLERQIDARRRELASAAGALSAERKELERLLEEKRRLQAANDGERRALEERLAQLGREAADLRDLMSRISLVPPPVPEAKPAAPGEAPADPRPGAEPDVPAAEPAALTRLDRPAEIRRFPATGAAITLPARGRITGRYGEALDAGQSRKGVVITTRPDAQIVAPFDGQVVFRGPFRGYGEILILEHVGGYHTLLAGLGRTDAIAGQWLLAGEPVGVMGDAGVGSRELYLELRRDGQPINPLPWLDISDSKTE